MSSSPDSALSRALLLAVDLQPVFLGSIPGSSAAARRCAFALEAAAGLGLPIVFTEQVPAKLGATAPELRALAPEAPVFAKDAFSALDAPGLSEWIEEHGIEHLLLLGLETPICIYQTAIAATGADLQVTLLTDCLAARRTDDAAEVIRYLGRLGCHPLPSETVFYSILQTTKHPFFRDYTKLVKKHAAPAG